MPIAREAKRYCARHCGLTHSRASTDNDQLARLKTANKLI
jgi:hypothetical protein